MMFICQLQEKMKLWNFINVLRKNIAECVNRRRKGTLHYGMISNKRAARV